MKHKFAITYVLWVVSLVLYIHICDRILQTDRILFLYFLSFGTMVSMLVFCSILMFFSEALD